MKWSKVSRKVKRKKETFSVLYTNEAFVLPKLDLSTKKIHNENAYNRIDW